MPLPYQKDHLTSSMLASIFIHVGMLFVVVVGLPVISKPAPTSLSWRPVPVDIVEIGEITNTRIRSKTPKKTKKVSPPKKKKKTYKRDVPKPKPKKVAPAVKKDAVVLPTKKKVKKQPPKPKPAPAPKQEDPLASVLKNVARLKEETPPPAIPDSLEDIKRNRGESVEGEVTGFGPALADRLTISQEDALRRQISSCWNMPIGARSAEDLIVEVLIEVNQDRTVRSAKVVNNTRMSDPYFRSAAEAALRALRNPRCSPLLLPEDQYDKWKTILFNFDPRDML